MFSVRRFFEIAGTEVRKYSPRLFRQVAMHRTKHTTAHITALATVAIWGTTFIATKILLDDFSPISILFLRFLLGFAVLSLIPRRLKFTSAKTEMLLAGAGLSGVTFYFLFENIALQYTYAANVGVLVTVSPFFTAVLSKIFLKNEKAFNRTFLLGFVVAMTGVVMISLNDTLVIRLNPVGDVLALLAAGTWAVYSVLMKKAGETGLPVVLCTRRTFLYGLLFMIPALIPLHFGISADNLMKPVNAGMLIFLGVGASALCFATWNFAVKILGAVGANVYLYLVPVVTVVVSRIVLREQLTVLSAAGTALTISGLLISEIKNFRDTKKARR